MKKNTEKRINSITYIILFIFSIITYYQDTYSITIQGMNVWNALLDGNFFGYYSNYGSAFGMIMNIIMGIWQLPLVIIERIVGVNVLDYYVARMYGKLFLLVFIYISAKQIEKIILQFNVSKEKKNHAFLLFSSNALVFVACCSIGQVDIIGIYFSLSAMLALMENNNKKFLTFFIIAVQCKYFPLFIFIPILLYCEKNIAKVIGYLLAPFVVGYIINLPFVIHDNGNILKSGSLIGAGVNTNGVADDILGRMFENKISIMGNEIPLIFFTFGIVCFWAFMKQKKEEVKKKWELFFGFIGISSVLLSYSADPYRYVYIVPFAVILIVVNDKSRWRDYLLMVFGTAALALANQWKYTWTADFSLLKGNIIDFVIPLRNVDFKSAYSMYGKFYELRFVLFAIFIIWILYFIIHNIPEKLYFELKSTDFDLKFKNRVLKLQIVFNAFVSNIIVFFYIIWSIFF